MVSPSEMYLFKKLLKGYELMRSANGPSTGSHDGEIESWHHYQSTWKLSGRLWRTTCSNSHIVLLNHLLHQVLLETQQYSVYCFLVWVRDKLETKYCNFVVECVLQNFSHAFQASKHACSIKTIRWRNWNTKWYEMRWRWSNNMSCEMELI